MGEPELGQTVWQPKLERRVAGARGWPMQVAHGASATPARVRRPLVCVRPRLGGRRAGRGGLPGATGCRTLAWRAQRQGVAAEQGTRCRGKASSIS
jgi:hypothetical protein